MTAIRRSPDSPPSSALAKTAADEATRTAQGLADHLNSVINRTVSKSRLSVVLEKGTDPPHFDLVRLVDKRVTPLVLNGTSALLLVQHKIEVVDEHCATLTYTYRYQRNEDPDSWICRWEYFRRPPKPDYRYSLSHVHVNADLARKAGPGEDVHGFHFPTARVPLELVLLHLIDSTFALLGPCDGWCESLGWLSGFDLLRIVLRAGAVVV
jgi:hypothetical protein